MLDCSHCHWSAGCAVNNDDHIAQSGYNVIGSRDGGASGSHLPPPPTPFIFMGQCLQEKIEIL